jgi:DNA mismatch endonuclease, patch repair protein
MSTVDPPVSPERSALMARVRGKNTKPEVVVRSIVHGLGYRFRLHKAGLPGRPDLVFSGSRKVIFVHGCFWHRHPGCYLTTTPKTRASYWRQKFRQNKRRDYKAVEALEHSGWLVLVVWECETDDIKTLESRLSRFLRDRKSKV